MKSSLRSPAASIHNTAARVQYEDARAAVLLEFAQGGDVETLWRGLARAVDRLLGAATLMPSMALVAVGGYGRSELAPFSDIDVLVLLPDESPAILDAAVARLVQELWALHAGISHATRTVEESIAAAQTDHTIAATMLDARYVAGDKALFDRFHARFARDVQGRAMHAFVTAKLEERDARHAKWGDSRFLLEPQVKAGKGALRDLQTLRWLSQYCFGATEAVALLTRQEWRRYRHAYRFFSTVRAQMHVLRGRADERLTFDLHPPIAAALKFRGQDVQQQAERLMRRYFHFTRETGMLTRIFCAGLDTQQLRPRPNPPTSDRVLPEGLKLEQGRLDFTAPAILDTVPSLAVALFSVASAQGLGIHSHAYGTLARALPSLPRRLKKDVAAHRIFLSLLLEGKTPELHLRWMNEAGVLGALLPEFRRVNGMMQYDGYHTYTVDEHSLIAIGNLVHIERGAWADDFPLSSSVVREIADRAPLVVALLCHDLAKGTGGNHAVKGAALVTSVARRLGLSTAQQTLAAWLVEHQELLSETAFKRDLDDAAALAGFVAQVQSPERLRLLLLLTVSDIKAVGPAIWNGWKGALMRDLYARAMVAMGVDLPRGEMLLSRLPDAARHVHAKWTAKNAAFARGEADCAALPKPVPYGAVVVITHDRFRAISEITCCTHATPTCFRELVGALSYLGASIVTARMALLEDGAALMTMGIQDIAGNSFADEDQRLAMLEPLLTQAAAGTLDVARELPKRRRLSRGREVRLAPAVFVDTEANAEATVIEVNAPDRIGLFYAMLGSMDACGVRVLSAHIATYGGMAVDVFYVTDGAGRKLVDAAQLADLQRSLLAVCDDPAQTGPR